MATVGSMVSALHKIRMYSKFPMHQHFDPSYTISHIHFWKYYVRPPATQERLLLNKSHCCEHSAYRLFNPFPFSVRFWLQRGACLQTYIIQVHQDIMKSGNAKAIKKEILSSKKKNKGSKKTYCNQKKHIVIKKNIGALPMHFSMVFIHFPWFSSIFHGFHQFSMVFINFACRSSIFLWCPSIFPWCSFSFRCYI